MATAGRRRAVAGARSPASSPSASGASSPRRRIERTLALLEAKEKAALTSADTAIQRTPYFCSGCPHNTSTKVPEGSRALAGIGCHYMVTWMDRNTATFTHMGGEGVTWVGQAPFTEKHIFANLGDGTYFHSGCWRSASRSPPASTSPTRSSTTTPSR
jgi:indolepyruvate ferredoxin oxidoreductase